MPDPAGAAVHVQLIQGLLTEGKCPCLRDLAARLETDILEVESQLRALEAIHGVVLHPHVCEPWVVHPFSVTPTANWIQGSSGLGWWAPCVWCSLGVAALAGGEVAIHTRYGGEAEPVSIPVRDGVPVGDRSIQVHFAVPPRDAWRNVHEHCSMVLPFRREQDIDAWCARHGLARGEAVSLEQTATLARAWYGSHARPDWHKWSVAEAQEIFRAAGLTSDFWDLGVKAGTF